MPNNRKHAIALGATFSTSVFFTVVLAVATISPAAETSLMSHWQSLSPAPTGGQTVVPAVPPQRVARGTPSVSTGAGMASTSMGSPFSSDNVKSPPGINSDYERVLDLFPDNNDRELIGRVRETVEKTEVGIDVTDEEWITVGGGGQRITWGGRIDTDYANWANDEEFGGQQNYVEFRRLRLMASGTGYGVFEYQLELNISPSLNQDRFPSTNGEDAGVQVKDAFLAMRDVPYLGYTMLGHFRTPIGMSSLTSSRFVPFMERSLPARLMPGRELGIATFNHSPSRNMTWAQGIFFDDLDESEQSIIDDNQGTRMISRATLTPFYDQGSSGAQLLHTGFGYSYNRPRRRDDPDGLLPARRTIQFSSRPEIHQSDALIETGELDVDDYQLFNLELAWANGPLTLQGEATYIDLNMAGNDSAHVWGAYVHGSWFLTGERRPYDRDFGVFRRVIPYENFWIAKTPNGTDAGLGAWELAARWSHLNFTDVSDQSLHDITVGVNWYWNPHTRMMFNWIHPIARNSPVATETYSNGDILAARLQLDF